MRKEDESVPKIFTVHWFKEKKQREDVFQPLERSSAQEVETFATDFDGDVVFSRDSRSTIPIICVRSELPL